MRFIDLSLPLDTDTDWAGEDWAVCRVERHDHAEGAKAIHARFGLEPKHLRSGQGWAGETLHPSTHGTTPFDAPWPLAPTSEGTPSNTLDQVPPGWCYGPGPAAAPRPTAPRRDRLLQRNEDNTRNEEDWGWRRWARGSARRSSSLAASGSRLAASATAGSDSISARMPSSTLIQAVKTCLERWRLITSLSLWNASPEKLTARPARHLSKPATTPAPVAQAGAAT